MRKIHTIKRTVHGIVQRGRDRLQEFDLEIFQLILQGQNDEGSIKPVSKQLKRLGLTLQQCRCLTITVQFVHSILRSQRSIKNTNNVQWPAAGK
jgi:hypothetical protein